MRLGGTSAGSQYDQLSILGTTLTLANADLQGTLLTGYTPTLGDKLYLIIGASGITGEFQNEVLVNGLTSIYIGSQLFEISYTASYTSNTFQNAGHDIALMAIPEPNAWMMLLGGAGLLAMFKRTRRSSR